MPVCYTLKCKKKCSLFPQIDEDMTARISMADVKFSFQCPGRMYSPAWVAPEGRHHSCSTDPKWQLEPLKLGREWRMHRTLDSFRTKCNLQVISPLCLSKSRKTEKHNLITECENNQGTCATLTATHRKGFKLCFKRNAGVSVGYTRFVSALYHRSTKTVDIDKVQMYRFGYGELQQAFKSSARLSL